jgi:1-phosphofructokinase
MTSPMRRADSTAPRTAQEPFAQPSATANSRLDQAESRRRPAVAVFAPSLLLTVTIENTADEVPEIHVHAGGQGFWVARMVARLEAPVTLCAPFGNDTGRVLRTLVDREGVTVRAIAVQAANGAYVHDRRSGVRETVAETPGGELHRHEVDDLYDATLVAGLDAGVMVLTGLAHPGIIPAELYRRLAIDLRTNGCRVVADLSGDALAAALEGGIDLLKISHEELLACGYASADDPEHLLEGIAQLCAAGARNVVVTRAAAPALARINDAPYEIVVPRLEPADYRGSGDSLTAGLAVGVACELDLEATLRLAAAAGALNVTRHGLGTGRRVDIEGLSHRVTVRRLEGDGRSRTTQRVPRVGSR